MFHFTTQKKSPYIWASLSGKLISIDDADQLFNEITSTTRYAEYGKLIKGTKFYDKSSLYHLQTEKKLNLNKFGNMTIGASGRLYRPDSNGSIFNDGYEINEYE